MQDPRERAGVAAFFFTTISLGLVIGRFCLYRIGYAPPINFWGRLITLRWVIPGYDQLYVGPASAAALVVFTWQVMWTWGISGEVACPVGLALVVLVTLTTAPGLTRWRLTGRHRLAFPSMNQQNKMEFVRVG